MRLIGSNPCTSLLGIHCATPVGMPVLTVQENAFLNFATNGCFRLMVEMASKADLRAHSRPAVVGAETFTGGTKARDRCKADKLVGPAAI